MNDYYYTLYSVPPFFVVLSFECRVGNDFRMMNRILPGFFRGSFCILFCLSNRSSSYNIMYFYNNFIIDSTLGLSTIQSIGLIHHIFSRLKRLRRLNILFSSFFLLLFLLLGLFTKIYNYGFPWV